VTVHSVAIDLQILLQRISMNLKRTFGVILTVLGIGGLIYFATIFMNSSGAERQIKALIVYGVLGAIFFFTGISLIRTTRDDSRPPVN
jgi:Na+-transporting NADH:ubiquinone oxidoreductase subunit NqrE